MNALAMRLDFKEAFEQENGFEVFLRAGHDAKNRKKTDRMMEFVFLATRRNSHEAVDVNVDPRQVQQVSSSGPVLVHREWPGGVVLVSA